MSVVIVSVFLAVLLDHCLGEPVRWHPLVGFGRWAACLDRFFTANYRRRWAGVVAWLLAVVPFAASAWWVSALIADQPVITVLASALVLYLALGMRSLKAHAVAVAAPLAAGDLPRARQAVGMIVSRDTSALTAPDIAKATVESVLENGADAVFAAVFWFLVAGLPGVVVYRLANTLDAMWGYKTPTYHAFGWASARMDDLLNIPPAVLTAFTYVLVSGRWRCFPAVLRQGLRWKSPNAGMVMAAGAYGVDVALGGTARYQGQTQMRPLLGRADAAPITAEVIGRACGLLSASLLCWLLVLGLVLTVLVILV